MLNKLLFLFSLIFVSNISIYSFYDIYGGIPFRYRAVFTGSIAVSSQGFNYTNDNVTFYLDYAVKTDSEFVTQDQIIVDWAFSKIHSQGLPSIVDAMLNGLFSSQIQDISYIVKVDSDQFWVFDKRGNRTTMGYYLENLFPIVNLENQPYQHTFNVQTKSKDTIGIAIQGGDYHYHDFNEIPSSLMRKNSLLINKIYNRYNQYYKSNSSTLFWSQQMHIRQHSPYNIPKTEVETLGVYFIDLHQKIVQQALLGVKLKTSVPYQYLNFHQEFDISLDGHFDITLQP